MDIKNSYLMWIGKEHYPTIDDYVAEVEEMGVSKRLPNVHFARKVASEGAVIFLVHDEGRFDVCAACAETSVCEKCDGEGTFSGPEGYAQCDACDGKGSIRVGTGGSVVVDGERWPYTTWNYWIHQPHRFKQEEHDVKDKSMCSDCGGTGKLPQGLIFGLFIPDSVDYIVKEGDDAEFLKDAEEKGIELVAPERLEAERKRRCGVRKPGGYYISTAPSASATEAVEKRIAELEAKGAIEGAEIRGSFARFLVPVEYTGKRFRGLSRFAMDPDVEDEAVMILEAVAS